MKSIDNGTDEVMFRLFFFLATRLGEFLALMPRAYNRQNKTIVIEQQVKNVSGNDTQVLIYLDPETQTFQVRPL